MEKRALRTIGFVAALIASVAVWLASAPTASAAEPEAGGTAVETLKSVDRALPPEAVRDLVARLDDAQVRELLLQRLGAAETDGKTDNGVDIARAVDRLQRSANIIRDRLATLLAAVLDVPGVFPTAIERLRDDRPYSILAWIVLGFAIVIGVGLAVERFFGRAVAGYRRRLLDARPQGASVRFCYLVLRLGLDAASIGVFLAAAIATFFVFYQGHEMTRTTFMTYLSAITAVRLYSTFSRFLLAPTVPALRLTIMTDEEAIFLHRQNVIIGCIAAFGLGTLGLLQALGVAGAVHELMVMIVGAVLVAWLVWTIVSARGAITADIRGPADLSRPMRRIFAEAWPGIIVSYVLSLFAVIILVRLSGGAVPYLAGLGSLFIVIFLPHIDALMERAARRAEEGSDQETKGGQYQAVVLRASRIVVFIGAVLFLARIWRVDLFSLAEQSVGSRIAGGLLDIGLIMLIAYVLWEITRIAIDRRLAEERPEDTQDEAEAGDMGGTGQSRLGTLLPLIKRVVQITIGVIAIMVFLSAIGVNIGPLLAGAGVIGLAIGFGAQTLVRDIVSGVFFLIDDAFRVGEYIDVGSVKGTVEKISIRSLRLRHHKGALHTIPFGEIRHLTNHSRDWVIMKLEFRVPFDTDINKVRKIFKQIGLELLEHPDLGPDFIQPFKSQGVYTTDDSALVIRGKFMAHPGRQFVIRREVYTAVQKAFAENGISFASRQVTVNVPDGPDLSDKQRAAVETAAASAATTPTPGTAPATGTSR